MCFKKIAIYVEGQTEQVLINHLILTWWQHSGISIQNIKLLSDQGFKSPLRNFIPDFKNDADIDFLITNVDGVGSLASAIAARANNQRKQGFEILGLRDLYAEDFENLPSQTIEEKIGRIRSNFKRALEIKKCEHIETIGLFFSVMEVESWLLAFPRALSAWAKIGEERIYELIDGRPLESIKRPSNVLEQIAGKEKNHKKFHEVMALVSSIAYEEIYDVFHSNRVPSFSFFWDRLLSLTKD